MKPATIHRFLTYLTGTAIVLAATVREKPEA